MSSPACADGYDTPAQQHEDSTTFMVAKVEGRPGLSGLPGLLGSFRVFLALFRPG